MVKSETQVEFTPERRPTLRDIANRAGLSVASVSMALRDDRTLRPGTISRVKRIADEVGYRPDPALAALAAYRISRLPRRQHGVIALILAEAKPGCWAERAHARRLLAAASRYAGALGYSLQRFAPRQAGISPARLDGILKARGIRGLLLAPGGESDGIPPLDWAAYSTVVVEPAHVGNSFHFVESDQFRAMVTCWDNVLSRGYGRVGLVTDEGLDGEWVRRWRSAHGNVQFELGPGGQIPSLNVSIQNPIEEIREWLRVYRPDVVISASTHFLDAATAEGLSIPEDIAYVSLDTCRDFDGASGIAQQWETVGESAVDILHSLLVRNIAGPREPVLGTSVSGRWCEGTTLPARSPRVRSCRPAFGIVSGVVSPVACAS